MHKNILFIFDSYPNCGGIESVSNNIIGYLEHKHSIYTLSLETKEDVYAHKAIKRMYKFEQLSRTKQSVELLNEIIDRHKIDCIINQGTFPHISKVLFDDNRIRGPKVFSFLHGMPKYEQQECRRKMNQASYTKKIKHKIFSSLGIYRKYKRYVDRFADAYKKVFSQGDKIVLLCKEYIEPFISAYDLKGDVEKVIAIENPLSSLFSAHENPEWSSKKNQVLFVGRLSAEKRVDIVLDLWSRVQSETDWELVIVGDGEKMEMLREMVRLRGIERVKFTGQLESPIEQYAESKIILLTSLYEGFPMCLSEAKRFGVVPIAFQTSDGVKSVVADGGVLVPQDDVDCMAEQLTKLINDDVELSRLSLIARQNSEKYIIDNIGRQWDALIDN